MFKAIILSSAQQDIREAANWYNSQQKGLGIKLRSAIKQKVRFIKSEPYATATRYDEIKTAVLDIFPFMIHYNVDETKNVIYIIAVLHTSRNPNIWKIKR